jgi:hypothetical protein
MPSMKFVTFSNIVTLATAFFVASCSKKGDGEPAPTNAIASQPAAWKVPLLPENGATNQILRELLPELQKKAERLERSDKRKPLSDDVTDIGSLFDGVSDSLADSVESVERLGRFERAMTTGNISALVPQPEISKERRTFLMGVILDAQMNPYSRAAAISLLPHTSHSEAASEVAEFYELAKTQELHGSVEVALVTRLKSDLQDLSYEQQDTVIPKIYTLLRSEKARENFILALQGIQDPPKGIRDLVLGALNSSSPAGEGAYVNQALGLAAAETVSSYYQNGYLTADEVGEKVLGVVHRYMYSVTESLGSIKDANDGIEKLKNDHSFESLDEKLRLNSVRLKHTLKLGDLRSNIPNLFAHLGNFGTAEDLTTLLEQALSENVDFLQSNEIASKFVGASRGLYKRGRIDEAAYVANVEKAITILEKSSGERKDFAIIELLKGADQITIKTILSKLSSDNTPLIMKRGILGAISLSFEATSVISAIRAQPELLPNLSTLTDTWGELSRDEAAGYYFLLAARNGESERKKLISALSLPDTQQKLRDVFLPELLSFSLVGADAASKEALGIELSRAISDRALAPSTSNAYLKVLGATTKNHEVIAVLTKSLADPALHDAALGSLADLQATEGLPAMRSFLAGMKGYVPSSDRAAKTSNNYDLAARIITAVGALRDPAGIQEISRMHREFNLLDRKADTIPLGELEVQPAVSQALCAAHVVQEVMAEIKLFSDEKFQGARDAGILEHVAPLFNDAPIVLELATQIANTNIVASRITRGGLSLHKLTADEAQQFSKSLLQALQIDENTARVAFVKVAKELRSNAQELTSATDNDLLAAYAHAVAHSIGQFTHPFRFSARSLISLVHTLEVGPDSSISNNKRVFGLIAEKDHEFGALNDAETVVHQLLSEGVELTLSEGDYVLKSDAIAHGVSPAYSLEDIIERAYAVVSGTNMNFSHWLWMGHADQGVFALSAGDPRLNDNAPRTDQNGKESASSLLVTDNRRIEILASIVTDKVPPNAVFHMAGCSSGRSEETRSSVRDPVAAVIAVKCGFNRIDAPVNPTRLRGVRVRPEGEKFGFDLLVD